MFLIFFMMLMRIDLYIVIIWSRCARASWYKVNLFSSSVLARSLLSSLSMLCCSWRRSRAPLSFLAALPDDLRLDEVADLLTSSSRVAAPDGLRPPVSPLSRARVLVERGDLADVDLLALPRREPAWLTTIKLFEDAPLSGPPYETVPPPPLSADPGVSLIAWAGAAFAKVKLVSLLLEWGCCDITSLFSSSLPFATVQWLVVGQVVLDAEGDVLAWAHRTLSWAYGW